ncbi:MAG: (d)CMP kinase [Flammeovirgaceae bacterium]
MDKIIIAIDGYAGCGKSSTAKKVAERMGYTYIDSGAMYRAVTLYCLENNINPENKEMVIKSLPNIHLTFAYNELTGKNEILLNDVFVENKIRSMEVNKYVSIISAIPEVRRFLVSQQQAMGKQKGIVMDGRDIGTTVFPDAELKMFMVADMRIRAERRRIEMLEKGENAPIEAIIKSLENRDYLDTTRDESPLRKADDAIVLDTSYITIEEQTDKIVELANAVLVK